MAVSAREPIEVTFIDKTNAFVVAMPVRFPTGYGMQRSDFTARCAEAARKACCTHWIEPYLEPNTADFAYAVYAIQGYRRSFGPDQLDAAIMWVLHSDKA